MEFIIECLLDLVLEGTFEVSKNKKVPKVIRYPLIAIIVLLFLGFITLFALLGISLLRNNFDIGLLIILMTIVFLGLGMFKFKKVYLQKKDDKKE